MNEKREKALEWLGDRWLLAQQLKPLKDRAEPRLPVVPDHLKAREAA